MSSEGRSVDLRPWIWGLGLIWVKGLSVLFKVRESSEVLDVGFSSQLECEQKQQLNCTPGRMALALDL